MEIVVNEWLLDYLRPDAEECHQDLAIKFVNTWVKKCDKVVIRRPSPFVSKFHSYMKQFGRNQQFKKRLSKLYKLLFLDSNKTIIADDNDVKELPEEVIAKTHSKDKYLIELLYSKQERIFVTTDIKLRDKLQDETNLKIYILQNFLQNYST